MSAKRKAVRPVFIIGGSRTGSEMLKTMLSVSPELDFVDELFLYTPRWLHKDLGANIRQHLGGLSPRITPKQLVDFLYSGIPYGWFWENVESQLDQGLLQEELDGRDMTMHELMEAIMLVHARMRNKSGLGAKFPMHYSYTQTLLDWYPDCLLVHTTRNPKAVYASQAAKYLQENQSGISRLWARFQQFVHINIQTAWTARLHRTLRHLPNYMLVRYEDVIRDPRGQLQILCDFASVPFLEEMLEPKQYGSSFSSIGDGSGVSSSSLERWRKDIDPITQSFFDTFQRRACRSLGYPLNEN
jgi:hypothetical protein